MTPGSAFTVMPHTVWLPFNWKTLAGFSHQSSCVKYNQHLWLRCTPRCLSHTKTTFRSCRVSYTSLTTAWERSENESMAKVRVVVEQFFGRMKKLWLLTTPTSIVMRTTPYC
eukprot:TRINITY_DN1145_c0_g1_i1.p1 TRINITY_DN1145_c0_g1~~TRINITY_DN1145_c0_g1_i1.p1  ORF type:complete len:112 (-),score=4.44 TRINITY_DN1145_c0_g1_i1:145-480(-)